MQIRRAFTRALVAFAALGTFAVSGNALAAGDYFLRFDDGGSHIAKGSSTAEGYKDWIEFESFSWGVSIPYAGGGGGAGAGKPYFSDFNWTQVADKSVLDLFSAAGSAQHIDKATAALTTMGGKDQRIKYFEMTFQNVVLTSLQVGGNSGSVPWLQGSFAYGTIAMEYWTIDPKSGKTTSLGKREFDLENNKGSAAAMAALFAMGAAGPQFEVTPVPEPETWAMLLAGIGLMGAVARRRRTSNAG
ncbi:MAG: type VI secretion system tube protein Hcp [Rhodocyclaceae bacterium]